MDVVKSNYEKICLLFKEIQSESQRTYPYLDLDVIIDQVKLVERSFVESVKDRYENMDRGKFVNLLIYIWRNKYFKNELSSFAR